MVENYIFDCTCGACPEQYDVIRKNDGKRVGYIRCRWGIAVAHPVNDDGIQWDEDIYYIQYDNGWKGTIDDTDSFFAATAAALDKYLEEHPEI